MRSSSNAITSEIANLKDDRYMWKNRSNSFQVCLHEFGHSKNNETNVTSTLLPSASPTFTPTIHIAQVQTPAVVVAPLVNQPVPEGSGVVPQEWYTAEGALNHLNGLRSQLDTLQHSATRSCRLPVSSTHTTKGYTGCWTSSVLTHRGSMSPAPSTPS